MVLSTMHKNWLGAPLWLKLAGYLFLQLYHRASCEPVTLHQGTEKAQSSNSFNRSFLLKHTSRFDILSLLCSLMVCFHLRKSESEVVGFDFCHCHVIHLFFATCKKLDFFASSFAYSTNFFYLNHLGPNRDYTKKRSIFTWIKFVTAWWTYSTILNQKTMKL